jgi:hypothetical protein
MKITKDNYNELRTKDLENNFAKVWHVNEIREELLANTPTGGVTEISTSENAYNGKVMLSNADYSIISTDTKIQVQDNGSDGFNFISKVPYHEVIGTISFDANQGTAVPTLSTQMNTALADFPDLTTNTFTRATWGIERYEPANGVTGYKLKITNKTSTLYYAGIFNATLLYTAGATQIPYQLSTITPFNGTEIEICLTYIYVSGGTDIKIESVDLNNNTAANFKFHLILPID